MISQRRLTPATKLGGSKVLTTLAGIPHDEPERRLCAEILVGAVCDYYYGGSCLPPWERRTPEEAKENFARYQQLARDWIMGAEEDYPMSFSFISQVIDVDEKRLRRIICQGRFEWFQGGHVTWIMEHDGLPKNALKQSTNEAGDCLPSAGDAIPANTGAGLEESTRGSGMEAQPKDSSQAGQGQRATRRVRTTPSVGAASGLRSPSGVLCEMAKDGSSNISLSYQYMDLLGKSAVRDKNAYAQVRHLCGDGVSSADGTSALHVKQNENSEVDL